MSLTIHVAHDRETAQRMGTTYLVVEDDLLTYLREAVGEDPEQYPHWDALLQDFYADFELAGARLRAAERELECLVANNAAGHSPLHMWASVLAALLHAARQARQTVFGIAD